MATYHIQEIAISDDMNGYYELDSTVYDTTLKNNATEGDTIITVNNQQIYTDLSGYVWEDKADSNKNTTRNNLYESPETRISGITVRLKNKKDGSGNISKRDF